jgi:hypothetical protein
MVVVPACEGLKQFVAKPIRHTIREAFPYFPVHTTRCTLPLLSYFTILDPKFIIVGVLKSLHLTLPLQKSFVMRYMIV